MSFMLYLMYFSVFRLAAMKRELKVKELSLIDSSRRRFLKHQQDQRRIHLKRLDDEIQRKVHLYLRVGIFNNYFLIKVI